MDGGRWLGMALLVAASCAATRHHVLVPTTLDDGARCVQECKALQWECRQAHARHCHWHHHECLAHCPGAVDVGDVRTCQQAARQADITGPHACSAQDVD